MKKLLLLSVFLVGCGEIKLEPVVHHIPWKITESEKWPIDRYCDEDYGVCCYRDYGVESTSCVKVEP